MSYVDVLKIVNKEAQSERYDKYDADSGEEGSWEEGEESEEEQLDPQQNKIQQFIQAQLEEESKVSIDWEALLS